MIIGDDSSDKNDGCEVPTRHAALAALSSCAALASPGISLGHPIRSSIARALSDRGVAERLSRMPGANRALSPYFVHEQGRVPTEPALCRSLVSIPAMSRRTVGAARRAWMPSSRSRARYAS
ncbi:hypothetical protein AB395_00002050 [Sinorhizobium fredii CCBAU 45436]|nr:hypothetical protein AB395_00002050 [Sinorhizobium fredii CCBAU 45436]